MRPYYYSKKAIEAAGAWVESNRQAWMMYGDTCGESYRSEDGEYWWKE